MRALVDYVAGLTLTGGEHDGELFTVLPWERRFLTGAFGQADDAALSVSRGNGKSALLAAVACAVVDPEGPLHRRRGEVVVVASSFAQGRVIYEDVLAFLGVRYDLAARSVWRRQDSQNMATLTHVASGARVRCIGSDPKRAHGLRPLLVLCDEPAQYPSTTSDKMLSALRTGLGKIAASRLVALGTRPSNAHHWFAQMLAGGTGYAQSHAAKDDDPPFQRRTWKRANPSLDHLPELERRIRIEAEAAKRDPALLPSFRALRLNQGTSDVSEAVLLSAATWREIEGQDVVDADAYVMGVDMGATAAMSAVAGYWPQSFRLEALAVYPAEPSLVDRGLSDGVGGLYRQMHSRGELLVAGHKVGDFPALLNEALSRWGRPGVIVCDRWRHGELIEALTKAGFPRAMLTLRGNGFKDGVEDVRRFREAALEDRLRPAKNLLLRSAMTEARVVSDAPGNEKLAKASEGGRRLRSRDDAVAAAILAVGEGTRRAPQMNRTGSAYMGIA